ncbi:molybdopterin-dependent oxidoreductase, partial [Roseateles sp.]|uniref:molybdopterin-dependent oxidoreductase n=1 Tax=Roseateles sp. TaxID=1971397 RepID=UPI002F417162
VNECWIADRDRFSYEALNGDERLTTPMLKQGGEWKSVDWTTALEYVANGLKQVKTEKGGASIAALGSEHSTVEELHLLAQLVRGLGSENIDTQLRVVDPALRAADGKALWLGTSIASLSQLDRAFVVGSSLRKDHPLFAQRLRQAARRGAQVVSLAGSVEDWKMPVAAAITAAPSAWVAELANVAAAIGAAKGVSAPVQGNATDAAKAIADTLLSGERKAVLIGNAAIQHPQAATLLSLANWIGEQTGATVGVLSAAANSVGAQLVNARPGQGGRTAAQLLNDQPAKALLLLNTDPVLDGANAAAAKKAINAAEMVVVLTPFKTGPVVEFADVLLPTAPFTETSGSFVNAEGRLQSFVGVAKARGETRPGWKILRVLGNLLSLQGFDFDSSEQVRTAALGSSLDLANRLGNTVSAQSAAVAAPAQGLERLTTVPIYATDALVRRATSLQLTRDGRDAAIASLPQALWTELGLTEKGAQVRVSQNGGEAVLAAQLDASLPATVVRIPAGIPETAALGAFTGAIAVTKA